MNIAKQDQLKTAQVVAYIIKRVEVEYDFMLELLTRADSMSLGESGTPMGGICSSDLKHPLSQHTLHMVVATGQHPYWDPFIAVESGIVRVIRDPGDGQLSEFDEEILNTVLLGWLEERVVEGKPFAYPMCLTWLRGLGPCEEASTLLAIGAIDETKHSELADEALRLVLMASTDPHLTLEYVRFLARLRKSSLIGALDTILAFEQPFFSAALRVLVEADIEYPSEFIETLRSRIGRDLVRVPSLVEAVGLASMCELVMRKFGVEGIRSHLGTSEFRRVYHALINRGIDYLSTSGRLELLESYG